MRRQTTRPYRQVARARAQEERRWQILRAAWELFGERRYDDVTVADIADRAGVGERTIYRLVGPKETLLDAWVETAESHRAVPGDGEDTGSVPTEVRVGWQRWMDKTGRPLQPGDLEGFVRGLVSFYEEWGDTMLNLLRQETDVPQFAALLAYGRRRHRENVDHFLGRLAGAGETGRRRRALLYALTDVYTWKLLRSDHGLSPPDTERALLEALEDLDGRAP